MDKEEIKIYNGIIVFSILFLIILMFFIVTYISQSRKFNKEKIKAEVRGSEMERIKLSSDLHDDLGPILATIKIYSNALSKKSLQDEVLIQKINKNLDLCLLQVRSMANNLIPNTLQRSGLRNAVEEFIQNLEQDVHFKIHLIFPIFELNLTPETELNIYRIVQEIVTNTIKHAQCKKLELLFEKTDISLQLISKDDGIGFDTNEVKNYSHGCGIANIYNRVSLLNGKISINSSNSYGTKYTIIMPIQKKNYGTNHKSSFRR